MSMSDKNKKVLPLGRPSSAKDNKQPQGKMQVLAPDASNSKINEAFSKTFTTSSLPKKEAKLQKISSQTTYQSNNAEGSLNDLLNFNASPMKDADIKQSQELKKVASKPFDTKLKKKNSITETDSAKQSAREHSFISTQNETKSREQNDLSQSNRFDSVIMIEGASNLAEDSYESVQFADLHMKKNPTSSQITLKKIVDEELGLSVSYDDINRKLQEIAMQQQSKQKLFDDMISHIKSLKAQDGESLVEFPTNYDQVVDMAYNEEMARKELKDKGMVVQADQQIYDYSKHFQYEGDPNANNQNGGEADLDAEERSPSKKQIDSRPSSNTVDIQKKREQIRRLDKVLAEKERNYREMQYIEKMKQLSELDPEEVERMSMADLKEKLFLTEWKKKSMSQSQLTVHSEEKTMRRETSTSKTSKPNLKPEKIERNFVQKNIEEAFDPYRDYACRKLTPEEQQKLDELIADAQSRDSSGKNNQTQENPFQITAEVTKRLQEIDQSLDAYKSDHKLFRANLLSTKETILPKEKALREAAEKRIEREKTAEIADKLYDIVKKDKNKELEDPADIKALVQKIKDNGLDKNVVYTQIDQAPYQQLEAFEKEAQQLIDKLDTQKMLKEMEELKKVTESTMTKVKAYEDSICLTKKQEELQKMHTKRKNQIGDFLNELQTMQEGVQSYLKLAENTEQDLIVNLDKKIKEMQNGVTELEKIKENEDDFEKSTEYLEAESLIKSQIMPPKTAEDYDREFQEKIRRENPDLFKEIPESDPEEEEDNKETEDYEGRYNYEVGEDDNNEHSTVSQGIQADDIDDYANRIINAEEDTKGTQADS